MRAFLILQELEKIIRYTLGKTERLTSRKTIGQLFKAGKSFSVSPIRVVYLFQEEEETLNNKQVQAGFTVSSKYFKKAVDRNRIKRLLRECWRLQKHELKKRQEEPGRSLAVFLLYIGNEIPQYSLIFEKTSAIIKRLQKIINENAIGNT